MTKSTRFALAVLVATAACTRAAPDAETASRPASVGHVVDSIIPMDQAIAQFQAGLTEPPGLRSTIQSRDTLVSRVIQAIERNDTTAIVDLTVDRAEWAFLYYPTAKVAQPPYELPPNLAWFQRQEVDRKGVLRALRDLGGHDLQFDGYTCDPEPTVEGQNRLWTGCRVKIARDGGEVVTLALFGAILERDGRFEILSFTNDF